MRLLRKRGDDSDGDALFFAVRSVAKPATSTATKPATEFAQSITSYYQRIASPCLAEANCSSRRVERFSLIFGRRDALSLERRQDSTDTDGAVVVVDTRDVGLQSKAPLQ